VEKLKIQIDGGGATRPLSRDGGEKEFCEDPTTRRLNVVVHSPLLDRVVG